LMGFDGLDDLALQIERRANFASGVEVSRLIVPRGAHGHRAFESRALQREHSALLPLVRLATAARFGEHCVQQRNERLIPEIVRATAALVERSYSGADFDCGIDVSLSPEQAGLSRAAVGLSFE